MATLTGDVTSFHKRVIRAVRDLCGGVLIAAALGLSGCGGGDADSPQRRQTSQAAEQARVKVQATASAAAGVSVKAVFPVSVRHVSWPIFEYEYRLVLKNSGPAVDGVSVALLPPGYGVQIIDGVVNAGSLDTDSTTSPAETIKIRKHWLVPFAFLQLKWNINFTVHPSSPARLR